MAHEHTTLEKLASLAKRRGFIYQGSEIYGGVAGMFDYGPYGVALKNNIKAHWWRTFVDSRDDVFGIDAAIIMNERVWEASGHTGAGFSDPVVECKKCNQQFRADHLPAHYKHWDDNPHFSEDVKAVGELRDKPENGINTEKLDNVWWICEKCGEKNEFKEHKFNLMFETQVGVQGNVRSYLRPETAQGIFVNFKNVVDSLHPRLPFGIAQIGKAFRNEISPREFLFRTREFEQMEVEYFVREENWREQFDAWHAAIQQWLFRIGVEGARLRDEEVPEDELAHYSKRTIDIEYEYPDKGYDELLGLAYRTDYDLKNHAQHSGTDLSYRDPETGEVFVPHVIEPSFGLDRLVLAVLSEAYTEDELDGQPRIYLKLSPSVAPVKAAVFPLLKNKPELVEKARAIYGELKQHIPQVAWDEHGNIGKRYRRQDEVGTPYCITIDFDTLEDNTVTVRDRDTGAQERVSVDGIVPYVQDKMQ